MRGFLRRTLQIVGYTFSFVGALLLIAWAVRGARPALECGVIEAARALDWSAAYACLDKADYDPLIGLVTLIVGVLAWLAARFTPDNSSSVHNPTPEERTRNRVALANRVQKTWIDGVLKQSLFEAVLIALGWQHSPESVEMRPWSMKAGRPDEDGTLVPPDQGIAALFDQSDGALVILGEPGAGKTTMLLSLTQELLNRQKAENAYHLVPIVFNLSSWKGNEPSLDDWLVGALDSYYDVGETVARFLVEHGELALMLDGLDEVQEEMRNECVAAINAYRKEHLVPVALCCRVAAYRELNSKLVAQLAVTLQPLTPEQQDGYLDKLTLPAAGRLKAALHADAALREAAESPLMLSVMLGAGDYLRLDNAELTKDGLRSAIWDAYLQNMLNRERKTQAQYPARQVIEQLAWLAQGMTRLWISVLHVEYLNSEWLHRNVATLTLDLGFVLMLSLPFGFVLGPVTWSFYGLWGWLPLFVVWFVTSLVKVWSEFSPYDYSHYGRRLKMRRLMVIYSPWLLWWMTVPLLVFLARGLSETILLAVSTLMLEGMLEGFSIGAPLRPSDQDDIDIEAKPNARVVRHLKYATGASLLVGVLGALFWFAFGNSLQGPYSLTMSTEAVGFSLAMITAFILGLGKTFGYYLLRFMIWLKGCAPLNYVSFLNYCAERILLRKVGGGYIFLHRTFMEHMATIDPTKFDCDTPAGKSSA
mgnify:CR=1 FL=1